MPRSCRPCRSTSAPTPHVLPKWLQGVTPTGHMNADDALGRALADRGAADRTRPSSGCCATSTHRLTEAAVVLLLMSFVHLRPDRPDAGRSDRSDDAAATRNVTSAGRRPAQGALRPRPAAARALRPLAGRRAARRFRLFAAATPGRCSRCWRRALGNTCLLMGISLVLALRARLAGWVSSPRSGRAPGSTTRSTCSRSPASRCRRSGSRCC